MSDIEHEPEYLAAVVPPDETGHIDVDKRRSVRAYHRGLSHTDTTSHSESNFGLSPNDAARAKKIHGDSEPHALGDEQGDRRHVPREPRNWTSPHKKKTNQ